MRDIGNFVGIEPLFSSNKIIQSILLTVYRSGIINRKHRNKYTNPHLKPLFNSSKLNVRSGE